MHKEENFKGIEDDEINELENMDEFLKKRRLLNTEELEELEKMEKLEAEGRRVYAL